MRSCLTILVLLTCASVLAQTPGQLRGRVIDSHSGSPLPFASVVLQGKSWGTMTDTAGYFHFRSLPPSVYEVRASFVGYANSSGKKVTVAAGQLTTMEIRLEPTDAVLEEVTVKAEPFRTGIDVPVSLHSLHSAEIQRNPGSDNDVSRVIKTLPGVTSLSAFRNDLIIRGGSPAENRFCVDEIEVPVINHLVTQGASGGAYSMINSNNLREVDYLSSTFPANRGNALSAVFGFSLKDANPDSLLTTVVLGGTDAGITMEGPAGKRSGLLFNARRSYRQYVLKMLGFAFFPVYNDVTLKYKTRLSPNSTLTLLGIGALDKFTLNKEAGDNEIQRYLLDNLPVSNQSNHTLGAVYKYNSGTSVFTVVGSTSDFTNSATKYRGNVKGEDNLLLDYSSKERSYRSRIEYARISSNYRIAGGISFDRITGTYDVFNRIVTPEGPSSVNYYSTLGFLQYGAFLQLDRSLFHERLTITAGLRADGSDYNRLTRNATRQLSGRLNLTANLSPQLSIHAGVANYFQLPPVMTMSYRNPGEPSNREVLTYLENRQAVAGFRWNTPTAGRLTVEGFYKYYPDFPFSLRDSVSLAHLPVDFGVFGNFPVKRGLRGRVYGTEFFYQQRFYKGYYGMASYTLARSEFQDRDGIYKPSSWDARHVVSLTFGKRFSDRWQAGINWRMQSPLPYTPFDSERSALRSNWDVANQGLRDQMQVQSRRGKSTNIVNVRVDRTWRYSGWLL
ncbi:MAG: TonB-dependent receptor, partial [Bacteroidota bacterium]